MKKYRIFHKEGSKIVSFVALALMTFTTMSCSSDNDSTDPYFYIEDQPTGITVDASGIAQKSMKAYTIRSNRPWTITKDSEVDWLHIFADEGEDDGIFDIWVDKNTSFDARTVNLVFNVGDQEQPVMFRVDQKADVPNVTIVGASTGYEAAPKGGQLKVPVSANVAYTATLATNDWAKIDSIGKDTIYVTAEKNTSDAPRTVVLTATGTGSYTSLSSNTTISQATSGLILSEHFDWMAEGKVDSLYNYPEVNYSSWSAAEKAHGWTTIGISMYGGQGYLKIGKTNYAGDLVSPALSSIEGTQDVKVSFKSIGYISSGGAKDDGVLKVAVMGGGSISGQSLTDLDVNGTTYKVATFDITVYPNSKKQENGAAYYPWGQKGANFSFTITGAKPTTQIVFVGGNAWGASLKGVGQGKNRLYLDDIKVVAAD